MIVRGLTDAEKNLWLSCTAPVEDCANVVVWVPVDDSLANWGHAFCRVHKPESHCPTCNCIVKGPDSEGAN